MKSLFHDKTCQQCKVFHLCNRLPYRVIITVTPWVRWRDFILRGVYWLFSSTRGYSEIYRSSLKTQHSEFRVAGTRLRRANNVLFAVVVVNSQLKNKLQLRIYSHAVKSWSCLYWFALYYPLFDESPLELHAKGFYYLSQQLLSQCLKYWILANIFLSSTTVAKYHRTRKTIWQYKVVA